MKRLALVLDIYDAAPADLALPKIESRPGEAVTQVEGEYPDSRLAAGCA